MKKPIKDEIDYENIFFNFFNKLSNSIIHTINMPNFIWRFMLQLNLDHAHDNWLAFNDFVIILFYLHSTGGCSLLAGAKSTN